MEPIIIVLILGYIVCGIMSYGLNFAYDQREYPTLAKNDYSKDRINSVIFGIFGPIGLFVIIMTCSKLIFRHGFKWK